MMLIAVNIDIRDFPRSDISAFNQMLKTFLQDKFIGIILISLLMFLRMENPRIKILLMDDDREFKCPVQAAVEFAAMRIA